MKCIYCVHHQQQGNKHSCAQNTNKIVYGELDSVFIEYCQFYQITENRRLELMAIEKAKKAPINDNEVLHGYEYNKKKKYRKAGAKTK